MELDIKLAYNNALEEITRLTNEVIMYKTIVMQKDIEKQDLVEKIEELQNRIIESEQVDCGR